MELTEFKIRMEAFNSITVRSDLSQYSLVYGKYLFVMIANLLTTS